MDAIEANDKFGCLSCINGYTGIVTKISAPDGFYIKSCTAMSTCSSNFYEGLGSRVQDLEKDKVNQFPLSIYVSCHECQDTSNIVFFGLGSNLPKGGTYLKSFLGGLSTFTLIKAKPFEVDESNSEVSDP